MRTPTNPGTPAPNSPAFSRQNTGAGPNPAGRGLSSSGSGAPAGRGALPIAATQPLSPRGSPGSPTPQRQNTGRGQPPVTGVPAGRGQLPVAAVGMPAGRGQLPVGVVGGVPAGRGIPQVCNRLILSFGFCSLHLFQKSLCGLCPKYHAVVLLEFLIFFVV